MMGTKLGKKVLVFLLLVTLAISGRVLAETATVTSEAGVEVRELTLEEAMEIAKENSLILKQAQLAVREAEFGLKQAEAAAIMRPSPTMLLQAQSGLDLARQDLVVTEDELSLTLETDFYNVLRAENMLQVAEEALDSARRHEDVVTRKFEVGTVTRLDVIKAARNVVSAQAGVTQARHGRDLALMKFRQTLGLDLDAPVFPARSDFSIEPIVMNLKEDLEFALANRLEIQQLELAIEVAQKNVELSDNDYTAPLTLEQAKINLDKVQLQYQVAKDGLTLEIRQSYQAVLDAQERFSVLEKGVEEALETLRLSELSYEANMITSNEVQDAQLAVTNARTEYINAVFDYNLAKARYSRAVASALKR